MGIANRIINGLVLLASIGAIVLAIMLFGKREEVVAGRNDMAKAISENSNKLSASSTENPAKVKVDASEMDVAQGNDSVGTALKKFDDATKAIILQRDTLAKQLVELTAILVEHDEEEGEYSEFKDSDLANVKTNKEKFDEIKAKAGNVVKLYKQTREAYVETIKVFEGALQMEALSSETLDPMNPDFDTIKSKIAKMKTAIIAMDNHIQDVYQNMPADFQVGDAADLTGENYADYLAKQKEQVSAFTAKYNEFKAKVTELEAKVAELEEQNAKLAEDLAAAEKARDEFKAKFEAEQTEKEKLQNENNVMKEKVASLEKKIKDMEKMGMSAAPVADGATAAAPTAAQLSMQALSLREVEGKVVYVNQESGFVVLNIGSKSVVEVKNAAGKKVKTPVILPPNTIMTVATSLNPADAKFVCKVQVYKVEENQTMANIISGHDMPKVGDVVYCSATDVANSMPSK